jgi:hypothetical protein
MAESMLIEAIIRILDALCTCAFLVSFILTASIVSEDILNSFLCYKRMFHREFNEKVPDLIDPGLHCALKIAQFFSHPDYTVGTGIHDLRVTGSFTNGGRGLYRRWGLAPRPEELSCF